MCYNFFIFGTDQFEEFFILQQRRCIMEKTTHELKTAKSASRDDSSDTFNNLMSDLNHDAYKSRYDQ